MGRRDPVTGLARRGTSNGNQRGSATSRRNRKLFLLKTYLADVRGIRVTYADRPMKHLPTALVGTSETFFPRPDDFPKVWGSKVSTMQVHRYIVRIEEVPCVRCYRCGGILTFETMTVDRIVPGCKKTAKYPKGGTYSRENIRPACGKCNSDTGGRLAKGGKEKPVRLDVRVTAIGLCGRFPTTRIVQFEPPEWEQKSA